MFVALRQLLEVGGCNDKDQHLEDKFPMSCENNPVLPVIIIIISKSYSNTYLPNKVLKVLSIYKLSGG